MFLATRVTFFNELYDIVQGASKQFDAKLDYDAIRIGLALDSRIGISHSQVPGYDGKRGWGGHCLPKDTSALVSFARKVGAPALMFEEIRSVNMAHRNENPDFEEVIE
jgi:UDPglucose 6-dehydrogenase